jgi:CTP synthase (UTP-ammonia lyase)
MQLILIVLTKRKETIHYCESFGYCGTMLSNIVTNDLTHVSVPAENGQIIPIMDISHHPHHMGISLHPHHGHFTSCPTAKHKQPKNLINRKEDIRKSK